MPLLKRYCCCMSLRTGGIMIGISGMLYMLLLLILLLASNVKLSTVFIPDPTGVITKVSVALEMIIVVFVSIMLILGAAKGNKYYLLPWLIVSVITTAGLFIAHIYSIAVMFHHGNNWGGTVIILYCIVVMAIAVYYWLIVLSLYQELSSTERRR